MQRFQLVLISIAALAPTAGQMVRAEDAHPIGIDVSHHSGAIDWRQVDVQSLHFVYVKATEGVDAADPMFEHHWGSLEELRIPRGAYHFYVTEDDPEEQAEFFLSRITDDLGELRPVVDIELIGHGTSGKLPPKLRRFLEIVETRTGVRPMIYTGPNFWDQHFDDSFGDYPLWVAEYDVDAPRLPLGWEAYTLWQFDGDVAVQGVGKGADLSQLHPDLELAHLRVPPRNPHRQDP